MKDLLKIATCNADIWKMTSATTKTSEVFLDNQGNIGVGALRINTLTDWRTYKYPNSMNFYYDEEDKEDKKEKKKTERRIRNWVKKNKLRLIRIKYLEEEYYVPKRIDKVTTFSTSAKTVYSIK